MDTEIQLSQFSRPLETPEVTQVHVHVLIFSWESSCTTDSCVKSSG